MRDGFWRTLESRLLGLFEEVMHIGAKVSFSRYGGREPDCDELLARCRQIMADTARETGFDDHGWSLRVWDPAAFDVTHKITVVAVDPHGAVQVIPWKANDEAEEEKARATWQAWCWGRGVAAE